LVTDTKLIVKSTVDPAYERSFEYGSFQD